MITRHRIQRNVLHLIFEIGRLRRLFLRTFLAGVRNPGRQLIDGNLEHALKGSFANSSVVTDKS